MLSEEQFSSSIEALSRLGLVERVEGREGERFRLKLEGEGLLGRVFGGELGEPPEGPGLVPWFSCVALKSVLERKEVVVSRDEFTCMAAVLSGFMSEAEVSLRLRSGHGHPVISHRRARGTRK
jgi:hypothetical protein